MSVDPEKCPAGKNTLEPAELPLESSLANTSIGNDVASAELYFPDGGHKAWLTVLAGWLTLFSTIGVISGFSVFESYYSTTELSTYTPSEISWIGSLQIWGCFGFGLWSGRLSDSRGPRFPLAAGTVFTVLGTMMASISKKYYQFILSQGICSAIGLGFSFTPAIAVQSQWFLRRRAFVGGLVMSGQNVGGVIWPILVNQLINYNGLSWGWTMRIIGFMQLACMVAATLLIQPRFPSLPTQPIPIRQFFTDRRTIMFTVATLITFFGIYIPYFYISLYGTQWGMSASSSFYLSAILNAGAFVGCYAFPVVAKSKMGCFNSLTFVAFGCAITAFGWIGTRNNAGITAWCVIYGFLSGAIQALFSPCISHLSPKPSLIGTWNGLCITVVSFAVLGTGPIAGRMLDNTGDINYVPMQIFTAVCLIVASVIYLGTTLCLPRVSSLAIVG
ncbi:monocarboxylate transporter [Talaromyces proteolyticus]|uniref:Monocarboxylate transporter n=1 Tax=Talaromyces proteolyticus TaxID=1131652 RepID=A0AAD4KUI5_9EURO|nr:monocarboxylate transporter [Talaromyces proteolyticus]KAH8698664.1 monocarboxylate transporter [Talaromyces proteolyticus]